MVYLMCIIYSNALLGNRFVYICMDMTERKALEEQLKNNQIELEETVQKRTEQLENALQVKSRFLATMSHGKIFNLNFLTFD
jgi:hypothetical protein